MRRIVKILFALVMALLALLMAVSSCTPQSALTADEVLAVRNGSLIAHGAVKDVLDETLLRRLYAVEVSVTETAFGTTILPRMEESR